MVLVVTRGRSEIWKSHGTGDHALAVKLERRASADQQRRWLMRGPTPLGKPRRVATAWFHEQSAGRRMPIDLCGDLPHDALGEVEQGLIDLIEGAAEIKSAMPRIEPL